MVCLGTVTIHGEVHKNKVSNNQTLFNKHIKLVLIADHQHDVIVDHADFVCASNKAVCPFEYCFDTSLTRPNVEYRLQAVFSDGVLAPRKSMHETHSQKNGVVNTGGRKFKVNSTIDTVINNYAIVLTDAS